MSIKYSIAQLRNPQRSDEPGKFYAKAQARDTVDLNRIAQEISYATTLTDGDVLNVLRGLIHKVKEHLSDGDIVGLAEFGSFQYHLCSRGAETKEQFTAANVRQVKLRFRPGKMLRPQLGDFQFERVIPVKARKAAQEQG